MKKFSKILACAALVLMMVVPAMAQQSVVAASTGDMGIGVWIAIMAVAVVVLIGLLIILAKKNKK